VMSIQLANFPGNQLFREEGMLVIHRKQESADSILHRCT
jgi:hypothetical protein